MTISKKKSREKHKKIINMTDKTDKMFSSDKVGIWV